MKTLRYSLRVPLTFAAVLCMCIVTEAANFTTTTSQAGGANWTATIWNPGAVAPTAGNTYECVFNGTAWGNNTGNTRIRNALLDGVLTFPGDSLTLNTNTDIRFKRANSGANNVVSAVSATILNFPGVDGNPGLILNGGVLNPGDDNGFVITGRVHVAGGGIIGNGDNGGGNEQREFRAIHLRGFLTGTGSITMVQGQPTNANMMACDGSGYSGNWIVQAGFLRGDGSNSLGTGSIFVTPTNGAAAQASLNYSVLELNYNISSPGILVLSNNPTSGSVARMILHQNCTFSAISINGTALTSGAHPYAELAANFPSNFAPAGFLSLIVQPPGPPGTPTNVVAISGDSQVSLSWSIPGNAGGYSIKRSSVSGGPYTEIATTAGNNPAFVDATVVNGNFYYYVIAATNSLGASSNSVEVIGNPNVPVTGITATGGTNRVILNWSALAGATSYTVRRAITSNGAYTDIATGVAGTTYTDTSAQSGRTYYYRISATLTVGGTSGQSAEVSAVTAPGAPVLSTTLFASTVIRLGWTSDPVVSGFFVEQSANGVNFTPLATTAANQTSYTNSGLALSTTYFYRVRTTNATGLSSYSAIASNTTPAIGYNINFQLGTAPVPLGYMKDIGDIYGDRTNAFFYGWTNIGGTNITVDARQRNNAGSPDLRYDTFIHLMKANVSNPNLSATWEFQIPNGFYRVHIVAGDPDNGDPAADRFQFNVEGALTSAYTPNLNPFANRFGEFTVSVGVSDGRLTIGSGPSALNNKIAFVDIYPDVPVKPSITVQPLNTTIEQNRPVALAGTVSGSAVLMYQWYYNNSPVPNGTNNTLTFARPQPANSGNYFFIVTNYGGAVTSSVATLTVTSDTTAPRVVSVGSLDGQSVGVCFTEEIDPSSGAALEAGNYQINGGSVVVDGVVIRPDGKSVKLHLFTPISGPFTLDVLDVPDYAGNSTISSTNGQVLGFAAQDIGSPALLGGNYTCDNTTFEIVGGGADIWANADQGYLATRTNSGNFDARVLVTDLRGSNAITKAVLTVREATNAESAALTISVNPPAPGRNQIEMGLRPTASNATVAVGTSFVPGGVPNAWMRITRVGNLFTGYRSTNGVDWVQLGQTNVSLAATMQVGIGVTAHDNTLLATGTFTGFSVSQVLADVGISGTGAPNPVTTGNNVTYSFTVTNNGPGVAAGVKVIDVLPAGATFVSMNSSQGTRTNSGGTITFDLGTLAANAQATVTIVATATTAGSLNNTASVGTTALDTNAANNAVTVVTTVNAGATQAPIGTVKFTGGTFSGAIQTQSGATYTVQFKNDLNLLPWNTLTNIIGDGTIKTFSDPNPGVPKRFYRIVTP